MRSCQHLDSLGPETIEVNRLRIGLQHSTDPLFKSCMRSFPRGRRAPALYVVDPIWVMETLEPLDEPHKKMVLEIMRALLLMKGKQ